MSHFSLEHPFPLTKLIHPRGEQVDTVVHLAADPRPNGDFHTSLLPSNVVRLTSSCSLACHSLSHTNLKSPCVEQVGVYNAFEAARQAGCRRILFASSVHAMLGYPIDWSNGGTGEGTDNTKPPNPPNTYGATKVWGEALCRKFSNADGLSCIAMRVSPGVTYPGAEIYSCCVREPSN